MFEIIEKDEEVGTIIKVFGVGGAGGNAIEHMINEGVNGVEFIAANTDAQALSRNAASSKLSLGKSGLGAGAKPEKGQEAAQAHRDEIRASLEGAHMAFITAGMGGGTGTGAAPVVAEIAREMGILTVGVVTKPFSFEGGKRLKAAEAGIAEFSKHVDSLIVILNDKLMEVMGDDADVDDCFKAADDVLKNAVGGIAEIITYPGLVNVDFEDVRTVMGEMGRAMMGSAAAAGVDRARIAAEQAVASPLLEGVNLSGAKGVLVNITAAKGNLKMKEVNEVMNTVKAFAAEDAHIIFGAVYDELMGDALRVTVVATGLGQAAAAVRSKPEVFTQPVLVQAQATGTHDAVAFGSTPDYSHLDVPAVLRGRGQRGGNSATVEALANSGVDRYDIPAFLRKQAD
ncbi:cell division protein FtsZ [Dechloromonas sp. XY25]|uniref:Cell division protein FtsZ n=1 Tax=Dechloromonas hankyongensis TaxID=2908002 RepID=A0ABS9K073_9RHOO|nr:cell division protein FtsZ [Dechloromonas hankyongensis]MCG2576516.1 cell division protein FtsZ [Dechloromonas hankyongensis]